MSCHRRQRCSLRIEAAVRSGLAVMIDQPRGWNRFSSLNRGIDLASGNCCGCHVEQDWITVANGNSIGNRIASKHGSSRARGSDTRNIISGDKSDQAFASGQGCVISCGADVTSMTKSNVSDSNVTGFFYGCLHGKDAAHLSQCVLAVDECKTEPLSFNARTSSGPIAACFEFVEIAGEQFCAVCKNSHRISRDERIRSDCGIRGIHSHSQKGRAAKLRKFLE